MQSLDAADRIEAFLRTQFDVSPDDPAFTRSGDLYELGYIDSVGVAELLEFLREEFGVEIPEADLLSEEFSSIDGIARTVTRLAGGPAYPSSPDLPDPGRAVVTPARRID